MKHTEYIIPIGEAIMKELEGECRMSEYGCCTLSKCVYTGDPVPESCDECPHFDPYFFKEVNDADSGDQGER